MLLVRTCVCFRHLTPPTFHPPHPTPPIPHPSSFPMQGCCDGGELFDHIARAKASGESGKEEGWGVWLPCRPRALELSVQGTLTENLAVQILRSLVHPATLEPLKYHTNVHFLLAGRPDREAGGPDPAVPHALPGAHALQGHRAHGREWTPGMRACGRACVRRGWRQGRHEGVAHMGVSKPWLHVRAWAWGTERARGRGSGRGPRVAHPPPPPPQPEPMVRVHQAWFGGRGAG
jgi:hypothetical protein